MKKLFTLLSLASIITIVSCTSKSATSGTAKAEGFDVAKNISNKAADIDAGHIIYTTKCTKCHGVKDKYLVGHTYEQSIGVMNAMSKKAHLTQSEIAQLAAYVKANAKK